MKHDSHFQPYAYGITAASKSRTKSRSGERVGEEEEEGF